MATEILTRHLVLSTVTQLWARAAGRCQFNNCNCPLYKSPVTQEQGNISEIAHIWSFSKDGPRGQGKLSSSPIGLNKIENLMLLCHDCHKTIDRDKKERGTARICLRTGSGTTKDELRS